MSEDTGVGIVALSPGDSEGDSGHVATRMLINIFLQLHQEVHVFTRATAVFEFNDERVHVHKYSKPYASSPWYLRLPGQLIYQLKYANGIYRASSDMDIIIFGGGGFPIPAITSKLSNIYLIYRIGGVTYKEIPTDSYRGMLWSQFLRLFRKIQYAIADTVVILSPSLIEFAEVGRFEPKCEIFNHYYFDMDLFSCQTDYTERDLVLGHIGASQTKGTMKLVRAFDRATTSDEYQLIIVGDGPELETAKAYADKNDLDITFTGYIERSQLPDIYNDMRLFINCSESEGVPKAMLEAMACGTPVAATPVGGVPDYLKDGDNGFLLTENDPDVLAEEIPSILENPKLESISERSREHVVSEFSYESAVDRYYELLQSKTALQVSPPSDKPEEPIQRRVS